MEFAGVTRAVYWSVLECLVEFSGVTRAVY